jgi:ribosome modulation factor
MRDLYSRYKDWVLVGDNAKYLLALSYIGADPVPGGQLGTTFFLENGWKIRPFEGDHTLVITGNLYSRDGSDTVINTIGSYNVRVLSVISTLVETVVTGGGNGTDPQDIRDAVWTANLAGYGPGTAGRALDDVPTTTENANAVWLHVTGAAIAVRLAEAWGRLGLDPSKPLVTGQTHITFGDIVMALTEAGGEVTVTRQ